MQYFSKNAPDDKSGDSNRISDNYQNRVITVTEVDMTEFTLMTEVIVVTEVTVVIGVVILLIIHIKHAIIEVVGMMKMLMTSDKQVATVSKQNNSKFS